MLISFSRILGQLLLWLYNLALLSWLFLHLLFGDFFWWLGLINSFVPFFFLPLLLLLPLAPLIRRPLYNSGLLIPLTLFLINYGILLLPKSQPAYAPLPPPIRIMTFNMWSGSTTAETVNVIEENGLPDIVALQETGYRQRRLLEQTIGLRYPHARYEQTPIGRGISILSRFPLTPLRTEMIIDLNCRVYRVTVDEGHHFVLYNCHPQSSNFLAFLGDGRPMGNQIDETFATRRQLSLALANDIAQRKEPAVVVGDFNTTDQSNAYAILTQELFDTHRMVGWGFGHTFPAYGGRYREFPIFARLVRIDLILYTAPFVALESHVSGYHGESDHLPVLATLAWRDEAHAVK